jgi:hypothetical protein
MAEHNQQFETFQTWVNKASSWLTRRGTEERAVCFDAAGRLCRNGSHFMLARDTGAFPVRWLWHDQIAGIAMMPDVFKALITPEIDA